jgi:glycogen synthase
VLSSDKLLQKKTIDNWGLEELERLLKTATHQVATDTPLCVFVDALDECSTRDIDHVINLIKDLAAPNIKFFVLSRPEPRIEDRLQALMSQSQILERHELTHNDIRTHVTNEFEACWTRTPASPGVMDKKH